MLYDVYTSRRRARLALFGADWVAAASAILFATGAFHREGDPVVPYILLGWSLIPRAGASYLAWFGKPRDFIASVLAFTVFSVVLAFLIFAGVELIWDEAYPESRVRLETALGIVLAWAAGFAVCVPAAYRVSDFFLAAIVVLGLLERQPWPESWIPVFVLALVASSAIRRLVFHTFVRTKHGRFNLQNIRSLSVLAALIAGSIFFAVRTPLVEWLDARAPTPGTPGAGGLYGQTLRFSPRTQAAAPASGPAEMRGYSSRIALSAMALPRYDDTVVLAARAVDADGNELESWPESWEPRTALWRAAAFARFDAERNAWGEDVPYEQKSWPDSGRIEHATPATAATPIDFEIVVASPVFQNLCSPYFTVASGPLEPRTPDSFYVENLFGDILPLDPGLVAGSRYRVRVAPHASTRGALPTRPAEGRHEDDRFLQIPPADEVGLDLEKKATEWGLDEGPIQRRLARLRSRFSQDFGYDDQRFWEGGSKLLATFLEERRVGDCVFFATSAALLLRGGGVSTRLVVGFGSCEPAPGRARLVVRNRSAHAWVEVFLPDHGWFPIDPTTWAPPTRSFAARSPDQAVTAGELGAGEEFEPERREIDVAPGTIDRRRRATTPAEGTPAPLPTERTDAAPPLEDTTDWFAMRATPDAARSGWIDAAPPARRREILLPGAASAGAPGSEAGSPPGSMSRSSRSEALRSILIALAVAAAGLGLIGYLRPRKAPQDDDEEDRGSEETPVDPTTIAATVDGADSSRLALLLAYHGLQEDLARTRRHRRAHQTPLEHGATQGGEDRLDEAFSRLHAAIYSALYGGATPTDDEVAAARAQCREIRRLLG